MGMTIPYRGTFATIAGGSVMVGEATRLTGIGQPVRLVSVWICLCKRGKATILYDGKPVGVKKDDMAVFLTDHTVCQKESSPDFLMGMVLLDIRFAVTLRQSDSFNHQMLFNRQPAHPLGRTKADIVAHLFLVLRDASYTDSALQTTIARHVFDMMKCHLNASQKEDGGVRQNRPGQIYEDFIGLVHRYFHKPLSFYADKLCISAKYLSTAIRQVSDRPPTDWIDDVVMGEAHYMLVDDKDISILDISRRLGFSDQAAFANFFKKHDGISPSAYRMR